VLDWLVVAVQKVDWLWGCNPNPNPNPNPKSSREGGCSSRGAVGGSRITTTYTTLLPTTPTYPT